MYRGFCQRRILCGVGVCLIYWYNAKVIVRTGDYRNLPNRGAGRDSKVKSDTMEYKLRF